MKYIVAVSGGVDSVALLDMLAKHPTVLQSEDENVDILVAHFDHGIREESAADRRFVEALATHYQLPFAYRREELGDACSEERARERRYAFLRTLAKEHQAQLVTAHHLDDLVETIAINLQRGTGWRGVAVLGAADIVRPLLGFSKQQLYDYALQNNLEWVEDETNKSSKYHRNRLRVLTGRLSPSIKNQLAMLRDKQHLLARAIDDEVAVLDARWHTKRHPYQMIDAREAIEVLRRVTQQQVTRPQCMQLLRAIKTAKPGTRLQVGNGVTCKFSLDSFEVEVI